MSFVNFQTRQFNLKIVYHGPGLSGKTTNIKTIYERTAPEDRGKLISLETETERTLFYDFSPTGLKPLRGFGVRLHLYTVPGPVFYDTARRIVLRGVDGLIFVADSQEARLESNLDSLENLRELLAANGSDLTQVPFVLQYNKRDLPHISSMTRLREFLNPGQQFPDFESVATEGIGVSDTLKTCARLILKTLQHGGPFRAEPLIQPLPNTRPHYVRQPPTPEDAPPPSESLTSEAKQREHDPQEHMALLRALLSEGPSRQNWNALCDLFDAWDDEETREQGVSYAIEHLEAWPSRLRRLPGRWLRRLMTTQDAPAQLRLARGIDAIIFQPDAGDAPLRDLLAWSKTPALGGLTSLRLQSAQMGDDAALALATSPHLRHLKTLQLAENITAQGAQALAESPHLATLEVLDLSRNRIGERGLQALLTSPYLRNLRALHLGRNALQDAALALFQEADFAELERLDLDCNQFSDAGVQALTESPLCHTLKELNLSNNPIGVDGCAALSRCQALAQLEVLFLHNCELDDDAATALLTEAHFTRLKNLALSQNQLSLTTFFHLRRCNALRELEELDICNNLSYDEHGRGERILREGVSLQHVARFCV